MEIIKLLYIIFMVAWLLILGFNSPGPIVARGGSFVPWVVALLLGLKLFGFHT